MLVWLASYPRSGSGLFRTVLQRVHGVRSASVFDERGAPGELIRAVSLQLGAEEIEARRDDPEPLFVKTHLLEDASDPGPAVHIVRDGRDALVSYARYVKATEQPGFESLDYAETLELLIRRPGGPFGSWSESVQAWTARSAPTRLVRFEELITDPGAAGRALIDLGVPLPPPTGTMPAFDELREDTVFTRRGETGSWISEMPAHLEELFWQLHGERMLELGYER